MTASATSSRAAPPGTPSPSGPPSAGTFGTTFPRDLLAGTVVFLVALPLCLGVALASGAPLISGLVAGITGGLVVAFLSGSHTSVSGPAAGLTAIVATQIDKLGSFEAFLPAVILAGAIQIGLGLLRAGSIASFFPSSVIKGLLAAIGVILILKQIPHVVGHDPDPVGEMAFEQPDGKNTFSELIASAFDIQMGAALVGLACVALLIVWDKIPALKKSPVPGALVAVLLGVGVNQFFIRSGSSWVIESSHLVQMPVAENPGAVFDILPNANWKMMVNPRVYLAALTIAVVASLETLLNLEAVDRIDPLQRESPPNRELVAQGAGNIVSGFLGGLPVTSVIVRSSVNINSGGQTRFSAVFHGVLLLLALLFIPTLINQIPLASLAAILIVTGIKLASPSLVKTMWQGGKSQFFPFVFTVVPIVLLDLLTGIMIGLGVSIIFILQSNFRRPLRRVLEHHASGDVMRIQLANQVSFLNRAALEKSLNQVPSGGHVLLDARATDYVDPDILDLIEDFRAKTAPARKIKLSLVGFKGRYPQLPDTIQFIDHTNRRLQDALTPKQVLQVIREGNRRFAAGQRIERDLLRQVKATAPNQAPLAVILSCMDSRAPAELIFDMGIGDVFSVRIAGNVAKNKVLGSLEYGCAVAGAKLVIVLGHTSCGAVTAAVNFFESSEKPSEATGCGHLNVIVDELQKSIVPAEFRLVPRDDPVARSRYVDRVARANVLTTMERIVHESSALRSLLEEQKIELVGGVYDVHTGEVDLFDQNGAPIPEVGLEPTSRSSLRPSAPHDVVTA